MALFGLRKEKEEKKFAHLSNVNGGSIKVLGSGCKSCHALLEASKEAVRNMGLSTELEYVTDMEKVMEYGVMSMPALVVNEKVVSMGRVLKAAEVEKLLAERLTE
ncbi:MAG: TM0996/MTH895 family glutaredoxin-like protein [Oscillospiraceae bacterium]|nr:TM0996/MTH895 family glutaredoxin-like protein [Oscillospiraceae bacterium]